MFVIVSQATAEANNLAAVANAKDLYTKEMEAVSVMEITGRTLDM